MSLELLGHMVTFWGISRLLFKVTVPFRIFLRAVYDGSNLSMSLPTLVNLCLFYFCHSLGCDVVFHCGFDLHLPADRWCWTSFHVLIGHLSYKLLKLFCLIEIYLGWVSFDKRLKYFNISRTALFSYISDAFPKI